MQMMLDDASSPPHLLEKREYLKMSLGGPIGDRCERELSLTPLKKLYSDALSCITSGTKRQQYREY
jgi:hypothetical protein